METTTTHSFDYYSLLHSHILQQGYKKFIVLTRSRTGSNMLISMLNGHPEVRAFGEVFRTLKNQSPRNVLTRIFANYPQSVKAVGFKIFYYHPLDANAQTLWALLKNLDDLLVIHLKRRDILRTLISKKIASQTDEWQKSTETKKVEDKRIEFTVDELKKGFVQTQSWEQKYRSMFPSSVDIYYEDLIQDLSQTFNKLTDHLGVGHFVPQTHLKKQNPEKASELIVNFQALQSTFKNTEWGSFFDESLL